MDERKENGHKAADFAYHQGDRRRQECNLAEHAMGGRIHRARQLEEMVALLPQNTTTFSKAFQGVEEVGSGMLKLRFTDSTTALASAVIGCDGIKSKVRGFVCSRGIQSQYANECAIRAMVSGPEAIKTLGNDLALNSQLYCGYGGYVVTYLVEHGKFINMVAMPHDGSSTSTWSQNDWTVPTSANGIREKLQGWHPPLVDLISRYHLPTKWALFTLQHDDPYFKSRICLLGDSAHATTPHMGAGASMAMEDAYILSHILSHILSQLIAAVGDTEDIQSAFSA
jgi:salicylate hydroxylase